MPRFLLAPLFVISADNTFEFVEMLALVFKGVKGSTENKSSELYNKYFS